MSAQTQFLFITHNKITMELGEQLVGVTMQEPGVSRIVEVDIEAAMEFARKQAPLLKKNIAFAQVPPAFAQLGREMWVEIWYPKEKKIERQMMRCWTANRMFFDPPRKKQ